MKEYDEATLKKVQQTEMEILRDFIKVCDENNLTWFGDAGSGIGALRHKGFIPWDDDIDVMLPRKDFDKMMEVIKRDYSDKYSIANVETMKNYPLMTTRIMMKGTTFIEEPLKNIKCDLGIFLDVYPLDNISDDEEELKKQAKAAWFWSKLLILRHVAFPVLPYKGVKAKITHIATAIIHAGLVVFRISHNWIAGKCLKIASRYNDVDTKRMAFLFDTDPYYHIMLKDEIYPLQMYDFEDIKMPLPANEDEKLRNMYGIINHSFLEYRPLEGEAVGERQLGVLISIETGQTTAYALGGVESRGVMFVGPGVDVYEGMIVGEHAKDNDLVVNVTKGKQQTNTRSSTKDTTVVLKRPRHFNLEACLDYINEDELVEVTPNNIRLRKKYLSELDRKRAYRAKNSASE